jgi:uncharacterized protein YjdB
LEGALLPIAAIQPGLPPNVTALVSYFPGDVLSLASYTAPAGESYTDINGVTQTAALNTPRNSNYVGATRTHLLGTADVFTIPWSATPVPMTIYLRVVDQGFTLAGASSDVVLYSVGNGNNRFTLLATSGGYKVNYRVAGVDHFATDNTSLGTSGDVLEFRCTLTGAGAVTLSHTKNGGAESTPATLGGATVLAQDAFTRTSSTTTLGSATTGGAWTAQAGTWGITSNQGYSVTGATNDLATLTCASQPDFVQCDFSTLSIGGYGLSPVLRWVDASNMLRLGYVGNAGALALVSRVAGTNTVRMNTGVILPTTGTASGTLAASIVSNVVTVYLNGTAVGTPYTLSGTEITAFGSSNKVGLLQVGNGHQATADNFLATSGVATVALPVAWDSANIEIASLAGGQQAAMALISLIVVGGLLSLSRSRSANKHPIAAGPDITPASIVMVPTTLNMTVGGLDTNVTSTVTNAAGSTIPGAVVTYTSDTPTAFTVGSSTGIVHAVAQGSGILTATTANGLFDTTTVAVAADTVPNAVTLAPTSATIAVGSADITFTATVTNAAGAVLPGASVSFTSSNSTFATINASTGVAHALAAGGTTITATTGNGKTATASLTVNADTTPATITVAPTSMALSFPGGTGTFTPTVKNAAGAVLTGAAVSYVSDNTGVATVNASTGVVTPHAVGSATVTASTVNSHTTTAVVTVSSSNTPTSIAMTPASLAMAVGGPDVTMSSTVSGSGGVISGASVSYTSNATGIATVNVSTGLVHAVSAGTATITGTTSNGLTDTSVCTVSLAGQRTLHFPQSGRFRIIFKSPSRDQTVDRAFANATFDDFEDTSANGTLAGHPAAISVQTYVLLARTEVDTGAVFSAGAWSAGHDNSDFSGACSTFADNYATAHGYDPELNWIHVRTGDQNKRAGISSVSPAGVVAFNNPLSAGLVTSYPYNVGDTVTVSSLAGGIGNGTYTIASLQKNGVTLTGWTAGQLGGPILVQTQLGFLSAPGDGTLTLANRKYWFLFSEWRTIPNFSNANCRAMHGSRFGIIMANNGNPRNAMLIDEMDSSCVDPTVVQSVEYGNTGGAAFGSSTVCPFGADMAQCLTDIRNANPGIILRPNTASHVFANDKVIAVAAGGIHGEQLMNIFGSDTAFLDFAVTLVNLGVDVEFVDGNIWLTAANNGGVTPVPGVFGTSGSYNAGNYPNANQRRQMASYALYQMMRDATQTKPDGTTLCHAICDLTNSAAGDSPISSRWTPAFTVPLGQPTAAMVRSALIAPPVGPNVRTFTRTFSMDGGTTTSAIAVISLTSGSGGTVNFGDDSLITYTLPAAPAGNAWYMLNQDSTIGTSPLTTLGLRRAEGVIVLAQAAGIQAQRADTFVDSIGTNIHMDAAPYNANFSTLVIPAIQDTGIRTVRSGSFGSGADAPINLTSLLATEAGTKFIFVSNPGSSFSDTSVQQYMFGHIDPSIALILEGPNEVDNNNAAWGGQAAYGANVTTFMAAEKAWRDGHADPTVRALPLSTPSVTSNFGATHGADWSSYCTYGTVHPYPGNGQEPGSQLAASLAAVKPIMASLSKIIATETGYNTAPNATSPSYLIGQGISPAVAAKYLPRLYAEYFKQGVSYTTLYELFDDGADLTNGENNFGILKSDGTKKPAYTTIKNLIAILGEKTWTPPAASVGAAYVDDTFTRANASGWGNATSGSDTAKTWVDGDSAESSHWAITSNAGVASATSQIRNIIGDSHSGDVEYFVQLRNVRASYSNLFRIYGRWVDLSHNYSFDFNPGVGQQVSINKNNASTLASASAAKYALLTNPNLRFRIRTIGSDVYLYARVWDSALTEPTTWDVTAIDKAPVSGYLAGKTAVWCDNNSSGQSMKLTRFTASPVTVTAGSYSNPGTLTPGRLSYSYTGAPATLQDCLLQKADGSFYLVLWNRLQCFNQSTKQDIVNAPVSVTIACPATHTFQQYTPSAGTSPTFLATATTATFSLPDEITILRIS